MPSPLPRWRGCTFSARFSGPASNRIRPSWLWRRSRRLSITFSTLWLPFFALNIIGEELWGRGFIQPRQEPVFGRGTWIVQGLLHGIFHLSFGPGVLLILWPALFGIPWAVQRTRNTSVGMLVHAGVNGPGFLAVTLGLLPT